MPTTLIDKTRTTHAFVHWKFTCDCGKSLAGVNAVDDVMKCPRCARRFRLVIGHDFYWEGLRDHKARMRREYVASLYGITHPLWKQKGIPLKRKKVSK